MALNSSGASGIVHANKEVIISAGQYIIQETSRTFFEFLSSRLAADSSDSRAVRYETRDLILSHDAH